jgi:hypothetical protein
MESLKILKLFLSLGNDSKWLGIGSCDEKIEYRINQTEDILPEMGKSIPGLFYILSQCQSRCWLF